MRANRGRYPDRNAAEQLLRGGSAGRPADPLANHDPLACLLAVAAAAPAHDRELAGEAEAVTAFRRAHSGPAPQPRRPSMSATKLLVAKAVLAAVGVTGGGVALAAATGHMPSNLTGTPAAASSAASATAMPSANGKPGDPSRLESVAVAARALPGVHRPRRQQPRQGTRQPRLLRADHRGRR